MPNIHISVLGEFQVRTETSVSLALSARKPQCLLAYLVLHAGEATSRDRLISLLWGTTAKQHGGNSLRQAVFMLRRAFERVAPEALVADSRTVMIVPTSVDVDAVAFERLVDLGTEQALEDAVALYRGDLLEGCEVREPAFDVWLLSERERLRDLAVSGLDRLLSLQLDEHALEKAIATGQRLLLSDPLDENTHRMVMRLYVRAGRPARALRQYELCRTAVRRRLGIDLEAETQALYGEIRRGSTRRAARS